MAKKKATNANLDQMVMNFAQLSTALVSFTIATMVIILVANMFFPQLVVLGNHMMRPAVAALYAGIIISVIAVGVMPLIEYVVNAQQLKMNDKHWMLLYWAINVAAIWFTGRFAEIIGMGISSWVVAVVLGLAVDLAQGGLMMHVVSKVKSN